MEISLIKAFANLENKNLIWHLQVEKLIGWKRLHCSVPRSNENASHYDAFFNCIETALFFFPGPGFLPALQNSCHN